MKVTIEGPDHLVKKFCSWFSNQGEQDLFECHGGGTWDPETQTHVNATTYMSSRGYGINEPIQLIEYDIETDEEILYNGFGQRITKEEFEYTQELLAGGFGIQQLDSPTGKIFELKSESSD